MELVLASGNRGKLKEMRAIFSTAATELPLFVTSAGEKQVTMVAEENGSTLVANALIKAREVAEKLPDSWVLSDDTGLFVEALGGEPGIYSARYSSDVTGGNPTPEANIAKLLGKLSGCDNRRAFFETCMVLLIPGREPIIFTGRCDGHIQTECSGTNGFGYDPVFVPDGYSECFAELPEGVKDTISHRAKAMQQFISALPRLCREECLL